MRQGDRLAHVGDILALADTVGAVLARNDVALIYLGAYPPDRAHAILEGADADAVVLPAIDQGGDVLRLQAPGFKPPEARLGQLPGDHLDVVAAVALRGVAAFPLVAPSHLHDLRICHPFPLPSTKPPYGLL